SIVPQPPLPHLYSWVMETARMPMGGWRRSRARSGDVMITAAAPSDSMQQSSNRMGSAISLELWWSSMVISVRKRASGLLAALRRALIVISPKWSVVVPYNAMCRLAFGAYRPAGSAMPKGTVYEDDTGMASPRPTPAAQDW